MQFDPVIVKDYMYMVSIIVGIAIIATLFMTSVRGVLDKVAVAAALSVILAVTLYVLRIPLMFAYFFISAEIRYAKEEPKRKAEEERQRLEYERKQREMLHGNPYQGGPGGVVRE